MIDIILSAAITEFGVRIGLERRKADVSAGVVDRRCIEDAIRIDIFGALGECAVCTVLGENPIDHVRSDKPDHGVDILSRGRSWSVKTCLERGRNLVYPMDRGFTTDFAALVWPGTSIEEWTVVGMCDADLFARHSVAKPWWRFPARMLPSTYLSPIAT